MQLARFIAWLAVLTAAGAGVAVGPAARAQGEQSVVLLELSGVINPPAAGYVRRGIEGAQESRARAVVLRLDTPGGLDESTREIVQAISNAALPVIVYVAPQGARAASAGTFITMAAHVAAMAPGTTIGSATPVSIGGPGQAQELPEDLRNKIVNEAVSYIRAHAEHHGRNGDWAEQAVREGVSLDARGALEMNVIEVVARDLERLLTAVDGMSVTLGSGEEVTLQTADAAVVSRPMGLAERFLHTISNPNLAFILLSVALLSILIEMTNPGLIVPGTVGAIALLLALYALGTLNAFWGGILLVVLAFGLLVAEVMTPTHGALGISGAAALLLGGWLLFIDAPPGARLSPWTLVAVGAITLSLLLFFLRAILVSRGGPAGASGYASLAGQKGVARTPLTPEGTVFLHGERWRAHSLEGDIDAKEEVVVEQAADMKLWVRRRRREEEP